MHTLSAQRRARALAGPALALGLATVAPAPARANGRFPAASQLVTAKGGAHIAVRTTFGLVQSEDSGATWSWICETAMGYSGPYDPPIALTPGDTLLAGMPDALTITRDHGCTWSRAPAPLAGSFVVDVALDPSDPANLGRAVAIAERSDPSSTSGTRGFVARTADDGLTWQAASALLPEDFRPLTIEVAARGGRLYASGSGAFPLFGVLVRSDDGGATWTSSSFDLKTGRGAYIAAVDPKNTARVYLRVDGEPGDRLLVSDDGATTWRQVFASAGDLLGFALSPDGARVAVGGPSDGIHVARTADFTFAKTSATAARCLTWTAAGLYACGSEVADGFTVGLSADEGATFKPLYHLAALAPRACPAGSVGAACADQWPALVEILGRTGDAGGGVEAGIPGGDAAAGGTTAGSTAGARPTGNETKPPAAAKSCGCAAAPRDIESGIGYLALAASALVTRRRTRKAQPMFRGAR